MNTRATILATAVLALGVIPVAGAASSCSALMKIAVGKSVTLTHTAQVPAGPMPAAPGAAPTTAQLPPYCRVEGIIGAHKGRDGKAYGIRFAVALPEHWNGRLLYQGGGGLNGSVGAPVGATAAGEKPALGRGFAVVSSDSGHEGSVFDSSFFADQQAALDFLNQDIGKVMAVARPLVAARYGKSADHSYFVGCSTGGREAMMSAQRYPDEFDGIVAGSPAMRTNYSNLALAWISAAFNTIAPKDAQGRLQTSQALSDLDRKLIVASLLKSCDALDGTQDGMIFNTRACHFDPQALQCTGDKTASCLSVAQVQAIKKAFAGPRTDSGRQVYPGYAYDTGIGFRGAGIPGLLSGGTIPVAGPLPGATLDVEALAAAAHNAVEMAGDTNAWTNLTSFNGHGGKLIFYHGLSDPWFSALDTVDYYQRLAADNGPEPVNSWSRLFLVPGMGHCAGGEATLDQFDMLTAIIEWVEQGRAPAQVTATGRAFPGRSRPLCPYPQYAQYNGSGDSERAEAFSCRE